MFSVNVCFGAVEIACPHAGLAIIRRRLFPEASQNMGWDHHHPGSDNRTQPPLGTGHVVARGVQVGVAGQAAHTLDVLRLFHQIGDAGVAEEMRENVAFNPCLLGDGSDHPLDRTD